MPRRKFRFKRKRNTKKSFKGGLVRGPAHPSVCIPAPWNHISVTRYIAISLTGDICITQRDIAYQIQQELGYVVPEKQPSAVFDLRVLKVDIWKTPKQTATDLNRIVFSPCDFSNFLPPTSRDQLQWYEAWGSIITPAHLHYMWPKPLQNIVLPASFSTPLSVCILNGIKSDEFIVRFSVLWRYPNPVPFDPIPAVLLKSTNYYNSDSDEFSVVEQLPSGDGDYMSH